MNKVTNKEGGNNYLLKLTILGILMCTAVLTKAQDIITLNNGSSIIVKLVELNETEVKYKKIDNLNGPLYTISKVEIFSIQYQNGTKEVLNFPQNINESKTTSNDFIQEKRLNFGGPRFGYTMAEPTGTLADYLSARGKQPFMTQFGWQFESRLFTLDENGAQGLLEFVPLIGGMEQGLFLPSANLLIGLRSGGKRGYEFAIGPNLSLSGLGMVIAIGTSFKAGRINFPVNLAFIPSVGASAQKWTASGEQYTEVKHTGFRLSLVVGFNSRKK